MFTEFVTKLLTLILGYAVPACESVKSIELFPTRIVELRFWCKYWIIVNIWYIFDEITDALASRIPMYRELKLAFIIYLSFPTTKAADIVYNTIFRPVMMLIMLCEWNIKWRLLPHLCETLDRIMCDALLIPLRSLRSLLPKVKEKNAESKVTEKNAESKVKEKNVENIRFDHHSSSSSLSELLDELDVLVEATTADELVEATTADELVKATRGGKGGEDMMSHRRRSVSRHLWGMKTYENKVHDFVESKGGGDALLCIWGKRGVGKSALLRLVRDSYAGGTSFDHVLFVGHGTLLRHADAVVTNFHSKLPSMSLLDKRVLLLVDDVREPFDLWAVGLPLSIDSKIICATRSRTVCATMNARQIIEMRCLGEDDAWNLFKDKVGIVDAHPHVHQLAKMVAECRGLPLALCVIGRAMSSKTDPREWRNAYNLLKAKHSQNQEDEGYSCLDILENELKDSFLVTSLWPKDGSIPRAHDERFNFFPLRHKRFTLLPIQGTHVIHLAGLAHHPVAKGQLSSGKKSVISQKYSSTKDEIVEVSEKREFF